MSPEFRFVPHSSNKEDAGTFGKLHFEYLTQLVLRMCVFVSHEEGGEVFLLQRI